MSWYRYQARNNEELIISLQQQNVIRSPIVAHAMLSVDRFFYSPYNPYADTPQSIGYGATISAPHMHAYVLELLADKFIPGERALDVGSGSGYLTACMAIMLGNSGLAIGIDHIPELVQQSITNIFNGNPDILETGRVRFFVGDGRLGVPEFAPYNAIHVGAAASEFPFNLLYQLKVGGRLIIPIGTVGGFQQLEQIDRLQEDAYTRKPVLDVRFVPLTDRSKQWS